MKETRKHPGWPLKILAVVVLGAGLCSSGWTQQVEPEAKVEKKDVPAAVLAAFAKAFPKATVKGYAREVEKGQTKYEVECVEGKTHRDVTFAPDGRLLLVEEEIEISEVPEAVRQALEKRFPKAKVDIAEKIMDGKTVAYEFHLTTAEGKEAEVKLDAQGKEEKP